MNDDRYFELPAHEAFGPQGVHVVALLDRARRLTPDEASALAPAWDAARDAALAAARDAARGAALDATWAAELTPAWVAALGLVVRDLIATEQYDALTRAWREVIGPIHPDDPDLRQP